MIPTHYPITMVDPTGREYDVHDAAEYVGARFKRGHAVKPEPKPVPAPAPSVSAQTSVVPVIPKRD